MPFFRLWRLGLTIACLALAGCSSGPKLVRAKGQLLYRQMPLQVSPEAGISIVFVPLDNRGPATIYPSDPFNRNDSTFVIPGKDGRGIPVGKYRIAITQRMVGELPEEVEAMNEMFTRGKSAIVRDVTGDEPIVLDLSKPEG